MKKLSLPGLAILGAFISACPGLAWAQAVNEILSVNPSTAAQGDAGVTVTFVLDSDSPAPPPAGVVPDSVTLGGLTGVSAAHPDQYTITAVFDIPGAEALGAKDAAVVFSPPEGSLTYSCTGCFTVTAESVAAPQVNVQPESRTVPPGALASFDVAASGGSPLAYQWQKDLFGVAGATQAFLVLTGVQAASEGSYRCIVSNPYGAVTSQAAQLSLSTNLVVLAADEAADLVYDGGFAPGQNGGYGFGPWVLTGGYFTGTSAANAGGSKGIDTGGRSWGLWSTSGVSEAVRPLGSALATGQVLAVRFDNGWITAGRSVGLALQNAAGEMLGEWYFSGGDAWYTGQDNTGARRLPVPYTADGLSLDIVLTGPTSYLVRVSGADGETDFYAGHLAARSDQAPARLRFWNYEAGAGSDYDFFVNRLAVYEGSIVPADNAFTFPVVDTRQENCYGNTAVITGPAPGSAFAGQDAQYEGFQPRFMLGADGLTVYDAVTRLTWKRSTDINDDGNIDASDKLNWTGLQAYPAALNAAGYGGHDDWRLPSIKELYSLMDFRGTDASGFETGDPSLLTPFLDQRYFDYAPGDTNAGERIIDAQYASSNLYVANTANDGGSTLFGVNFADGRIKGYGLTLMGQDKTFYVAACRGNEAYGLNQFADQGDGTVIDLATGLTWQQADSAYGMDWEDALAYAEGLSLGGYQDWRLPNAKELQGLLDYARAPSTSGSAAIDPVFACSAITNEAGELDFPAFWSSTTHATWTGSGLWGVYVCFGRAMGYMSSTWVDVHGAGAQRSDPKYDDGTDYSTGHGPQGDAVRILNFVRCVRGGAEAPSDDADQDGLSDWFEYSYTTSTTAMAAGGDLDGDGFDNRSEAGAGTSPIHAGSSLYIGQAAWTGTTGVVVSWPGVVGRTYRLERTLDLSAGIYETAADGLSGTPPLNVFTDVVNEASMVFYRIGVN